MKHLFEKLREDTLNWRNEGYPCPDSPLIGEILRYSLRANHQSKSPSDTSANLNSNHWNFTGF